MDIVVGVVDVVYVVAVEYGVTVGIVDVDNVVGTVVNDVTGVTVVISVVSAKIKDEKCFLSDFFFKKKKLFLVNR